MSETFDEFMRRRERAAQAYVAGDPAPVAALSAATGQATFFDPRGGFTEGASQVNQINQKGARSFGTGGQTQFDVKDKAGSGELAFWTGYQNAQVEVKESGKIVAMKLRVTEVFRRINGEWRMIHRHASMAKEE